MSIDGVSGKTSYIGTSILNLRSQLDDLQTQLASGKVSTTYAGQGPDRGLCARFARADLDHRRLCGHRDQRQHAHQRRQPDAAGTGQDRQLRSRVPSSSSTIVLNNNGQTSGQITAQAAFANAVSVLNTQSGERFLFSGRATDTPPTAPANDMLYGTGTQAGLTQMIGERQAGRSGPERYGASCRHLAAADDNGDQCRRRWLGLRTEAPFGEFLADRCCHRPAVRRAAGGRRSISAPSIRTTARRSSSISNCPTARPKSIELTALTTTTPPPVPDPS